MKVNDHIGVRFDTSPLWAKNQNSLPIFHQAPRSCQAEFALIVGEETCSATFWWNPIWWRGTGKEALNPWTLFTNPKVQPSLRRCPHDLAEPQARRPPIVLD